MGAPGEVEVLITTVFDSVENSASRTLRIRKSRGLTFVHAMGDSEWWDINRELFADTIHLSDGLYTVRQGRDKWEVVT